MKMKLCFIGVLLFAGTLGAAEAGPKEEVEAGAKRLSEAPNYSWRTTIAAPGGQFRGGPIDGMTTKEGLTYVKVTFGDDPIEVVAKGDKAAVLDDDGAWVSAAELENAEGRGRFLAFYARNVATPAAQAAELASQTTELKKEGDVFSGDLTEEAAKALLRFRRAGDAPAATGARGAVKFWLKDGSLAKYEYQVQGAINVNGNNVNLDRTTTVEIKDVGATKLNVADQARKIVD
jgi:hypothetical protein